MSFLDDLPEEKRKELIFLKEVRQRLYRKNPYCYWCGRRVYLKKNKVRVPRRKTYNLHPAQATIDHLVSKNHKHKRKNGGKYEVVLSCYGCNQQRNIKENMALPTIKKHRNGGRSWWKIICLLWRDYKKNKKHKLNENTPQHRPNNDTPKIRL